jgi:hypothetical protein
MNAVSRRKFLVLAGLGSGGAAALPAAQWLARGRTQDVLAFRAVAGLPAAPLPSYASYVLEGHLDLAGGSGRLTRTLYAGAPSGTSTIALPGLTQSIRVTDVREVDGVLHVGGAVDDRSQLQPGESSVFSLRVDPTGGRASATFLGSDIALAVERLTS